LITTKIKTAISQLQSSSRAYFQQLRLWVAFTSSAQMRKPSSAFGAKIMLIATPAASRPRAISTRPIRGVLLSNREGYVPNVVCTCGGMRHNQHIVLPYAVSDTFCRVATMEIAALIESL